MLGGGALFPGVHSLARAQTAAMHIPCIPKSLHYCTPRSASSPSLSLRGQKKKTTGHLDLSPSEPYTPPASPPPALAPPCPNRSDLLISPSLCLELLPHGAPWKSSVNSAPQMFLSRDDLWKPSPWCPLERSSLLMLLGCISYDVPWRPSLVVLPGGPPL